MFCMRKERIPHSPYCSFMGSGACVSYCRVNTPSSSLSRLKECHRISVTCVAGCLLLAAFEDARTSTLEGEGVHLHVIYVYPFLPYLYHLTYTWITACLCLMFPPFQPPHEAGCGCPLYIAIGVQGSIPDRFLYMYVYMGLLCVHVP